MLVRMRVAFTMLGERYSASVDTVDGDTFGDGEPLVYCVRHNATVAYLESPEVFTTQQFAELAATALALDSLVVFEKF